VRRESWLAISSEILCPFFTTTAVGISLTVKRYGLPGSISTHSSSAFQLCESA
jgi:hypothetical protein